MFWIARSFLALLRRLKREEHDGRGGMLVTKDVKRMENQDQIVGWIKDRLHAIHKDEIQVYPGLQRMRGARLGAARR